MPDIVPAAPPPSVYRADAVPPLATRPLDQDRRVSVAIIGAGIAGLSTALHLAEAGTDVVVIDAREPGWGASGNNGGQLNPGLKYDPAVIEATYGPDLGHRMVRFAYGTTDYAFDLIRRLGIDCGARQNGTLRAAYGDASVGSVETTARQCQERGMPVDLLDAAAVARVTGTDRYKVALFDKRGGDLHPLNYTRGLAKAAAAAGASIHGGTPATRLQRAGSHWRITTPRATILADKILIATNGFTDGLWPGLRRTIVPVFSAIAATEPLPEPIAKKILPARCSTYESGRITVYFRVDQANRLLMGGRGPMRPIARPDQIAYLTRYAVRLWPELTGVSWRYGWNSRLAMTKDHWPHIHEPAEDALAYLGCNGRGVALATAMGRQLANRLIQGRAFDLDMPVVSMKPIRFHEFWPLGVRAVVMHGRICDRLGL
ncbi:oxidoreductase [Aliidongia dinghuensis]|uniref:Oxidoreductase n=1 Tax=Aliidongia dinghuensis TaxID=1867774 RepID=A0A8J2Z172_9PROT|nr:FAD-binding oxidoreductase [Aliidongia dinghuensis]GGF43108.1 oxidoreductase [Aliidongia dinghuensis]